MAVAMHTAMHAAAKDMCAYVPEYSKRVKNISPMEFNNRI